MGNPFQKTLPDGRNVLRGDVWFTMNSIINYVIYLLLVFHRTPGKITLTPMHVAADFKAPGQVYPKNGEQSSLAQPFTSHWIHWI